MSGATDLKAYSFFRGRQYPTRAAAQEAHRARGRARYYTSRGLPVPASVRAHVVKSAGPEPAAALIAVPRNLLVQPPARGSVAMALLYGWRR